MLSSSHAEVVPKYPTPASASYSRQAGLAALVQLLLAAYLVLGIPVQHIQSTDGEPELPRVGKFPNRAAQADKLVTGNLQQHQNNSISYSVVHTTLIAVMIRTQVASIASGGLGPTCS